MRSGDGAYSGAAVPAAAANTPACASASASVVAGQHQRVPDPMPVVDGLLAASAKVRGWTLVTRNIADLARSGIAPLNPFDPSP
jgi:predicted nucleic acid-binding protein